MKPLTQMCHRCDTLFKARRIQDHCPVCTLAAAREIRK